MLLITHGCNLNCSYCYEEKNTLESITVKKAKQYLKEQIFCIENEYDSFEVQFMGGEPLLKFSLIKELSEWLWSTEWPKQLLTIYIPTNGTLLNKTRKEWFSTNRERICLGLSFDGNLTMQDKNRSCSSKKIDLNFFASTWPEQSVKLTISPDTINSLSDGVLFLNKYGFSHISADLAMGGNIKWNSGHLFAFRNQIRIISNNIQKGTLPETVFSMLSLPILSMKTICKEYSGKQCNCGESLICVDIDGKVYPCHLFTPLSAGKHNSIEEIFDVDFADHSLFNLGKCKDCLINAICNNHCYGMNYKTYGSLSNSSLFHCQAFKLLFIENCLLQYKLAEKKDNDFIKNNILEIINSIKYNHVK